jgi:hypothetical protein
MNIQDRTILFLDKKKNKVDQIKNKLEVAELQECKFRPIIVKNIFKAV